MGKTYCYVGNWGKDGKSIGYTVCDYDEETGALTLLTVTCDGLSVGAHFVDADRKILYCANETGDYPGLRRGGGGSVFAYRIDPENGNLELLSTQPTWAPLTSYVAMSPDKKFLVATNHGGGSCVTRSTCDAFGRYHVEVLHDDSTVVLYPVAEDGSIGEILDVCYLDGTGPEPNQFMSHAHSVHFAPDGSFFVVCDKGGDQVFSFKIDEERGKIEPCCPPFHARPGSMPRYSAFHPAGPWVYTNNENIPILYQFGYDADGTITCLDTLSGVADDTVPADDGKPMQSDLCVSSDGAHLYSMLRGQNLASVYDIDPETGKLTPVQSYHLEYDNPRGCTLSPDGRFLLVAAIGSHKVAVYPLNAEGLIEAPVCVIDQPTPCCITFFQA